MGCPDSAFELVHKAYNVMHDWKEDAPMELFAKSEDLLEAALAKCPGNSRVIDAVIGYHNNTGPSQGYYGLIWFSLAGGRNDYHSAFRYSNRIVQIRPRMGPIMVKDQYGAGLIARTAASEGDWHACQAILETALQWDPLVANQVGGEFMRSAYSVGLAGDTTNAIALIERATTLVTPADLTRIVGFAPPSWEEEIQGWGWLGLAMLAIKQGDSETASVCVTRAIELSGRCKLTWENDAGFRAILYAADSAGLADVKQKCLSVTTW